MTWEQLQKGAATSDGHTWLSTLRCGSAAYAQTRARFADSLPPQGIDAQRVVEQAMLGELHQPCMRRYMALEWLRAHSGSASSGKSKPTRNVAAKSRRWRQT